MKKRDARRIVLSAAVLGLALRLAFGLEYWAQKPLTKDEHEYLALARSLAHRQGFQYDESISAVAAEPVGRAPGYPLFLAVAGGGRQPTEAVPTSVKVVQSAIGAIGVLLAGVLAARLAGPKAGAIAAGLAACYPPLVWVSAYALSEGLVWPLALTIVWLFDPPSWSGWGGRARCLGCGALAGASTLVHPAMLFFAALATAWLLCRRLPTSAGVFTLGALLVIAPWTARNYRSEGRFVLIASEGGVTFWTGNHQLALGEGDLAANPDIGRDREALRAQYPSLTAAQMEPIYYRAAFGWIRTHITAWILLEGRKLFYLVVPIGPSYRLHSRRYYAVSVIAYPLMLLMAAVGFVRLGPRRARLPALWMLAGAGIVVALTFFPQERFRLALIDPALVVCAGAAWSSSRASGIGLRAARR